MRFLLDNDLSDQNLNFCARILRSVVDGDHSSTNRLAENSYTFVSSNSVRDQNHFVPSCLIFRVYH